jgi:hypothetical protein
MRTRRHSPTYPVGRTPDRRGERPLSSPQRSPRVHRQAGTIARPRIPGRGPCRPRTQPDQLSESDGHRPPGLPEWRRRRRHTSLPGLAPRADERACKTVGSLSLQAPVRERLVVRSAGSGQPVSRPGANTGDTERANRPSHRRAERELGPEAATVQVARRWNRNNAHNCTPATSALQSVPGPAGLAVTVGG